MGWVQLAVPLYSVEHLEGGVKSCCIPSVNILLLWQNYLYTAVKQCSKEGCALDRVLDEIANRLNHEIQIMLLQTARNWADEMKHAEGFLIAKLDDQFHEQMEHFDDI